MLGPVQEAAKLVLKRVRCGVCDARLGAYKVLQDDGIWRVRTSRLPGGMVEVVQPARKPDGPYFALEWSVRGEGERSLGSRIPRYRWRCPQGHERILRGDTLARIWSPRDGTETV
jgi:hypothetical protein